MSWLAGLMQATFAEIPDLILLDVAVVFVERRGERIRPVVPAHEVEIWHVRRMRGGLERSLPRGGKRPGRQAGISIGVVPGIELQMSSRQVPVVPSGPLE